MRELEEERPDDRQARCGSSPPPWCRDRAAAGSALRCSGGAGSRLPACRSPTAPADWSQWPCGRDRWAETPRPQASASAVPAAASRKSADVGAGHRKPAQAEIQAAAERSGADDSSCSSCRPSTSRRSADRPHSWRASSQTAADVGLQFQQALKRSARCSACRRRCEFQDDSRCGLRSPALRCDAAHRRAWSLTAPRKIAGSFMSFQKPATPLFTKSA